MPSLHCTVTLIPVISIQVLCEQQEKHIKQVNDVLSHKLNQNTSNPLHKRSLCFLLHTTIFTLII